MGNLTIAYVLHCELEILLLGIYPEVSLQKNEILYTEAICSDIIYNNKRLEAFHMPLHKKLIE